MPAAKRQPAEAAEHPVEDSSTSTPPSEDDKRPSLASQSGSIAEGGVLPFARVTGSVLNTYNGEMLVPRSDDDALTGHFANITSGEFAPRYGVVGATVERDTHGYPKTVWFRTRDERDELLIVDYSDLRPAQGGGRH